MARRQRPTAGLSEKMLLARLTRTNHALAARALRRHDTWQQAVERGATSATKRTLRRAWERARDEALVALNLTMADRERASPVRPTAAPVTDCPGGGGVAALAQLSAPTVPGPAHVPDHRRSSGTDPTRDRLRC